MPRLRDLADQQPYQVDRTLPSRRLQPLFHSGVDLDLISERWDLLVRVAASLRNRVVSAHAVLQHLSSASPSDRVAKARTTLGRIVKTTFILLGKEGAKEFFAKASSDSASKFIVSCLRRRQQTAVRLRVLFSSTFASMASLEGVTDFLPCPFVRVRKQCPAARFFMSRTLMPKRDQARFDVNISGVHG